MRSVSAAGGLSERSVWWRVVPVTAYNTQSLLESNNLHASECDVDERTEMEVVAVDDPGEPDEQVVAVKTVVCESCGAADYEVV